MSSQSIAHRINIPLGDTIAQLRALVVLRDEGQITEEEYRRRFDRINAQHGETCGECRRGIAVYIHTDGRHLCGACALPLVQS